MRILAIDPGPKESAYVDYSPGTIHGHGKVPSEWMLRVIRGMDGDAIVVERVESFGMAVGAEVFETVWWAGRFAQCAEADGFEQHRLGRMAVKMHLCKRSTAKDSNIRQAIIDRYGGEAATKPRPKCGACKGRGATGRGKARAECPACKGVGFTGTDGALLGIAGDCWAALALAITWTERAEITELAEPKAVQE